jgi:hypothetical protein
MGRDKTATLLGIGIAIYGVVMVSQSISIYVDMGSLFAALVIALTGVLIVMLSD